MIKVENVSFRYKNSDNYILNNISFKIKEGEIVAIIGKNGSGKSTFGKLISGIIKTKEGKIKIDDIDIKNKDISKKIGIIFQNPENQIIFNNIYDELSFSLKELNKNEIEERINNSLEQVGMLEYKNKELYTLSLGQKQRIVIAEILARKTKYIIFDEPTSMIDSNGKEAIYEMIFKLKNLGYTIIYITNFADEILIADRTIILDNGKIIEEILKEELVNKSHIFEKYNLKKPLLIEIISKLKKNGIILDIKNFTIDELITQLKEKM